jgi:sporulation protein YlmC with PRC-barrel domain
MKKESSMKGVLASVILILAATLAAASISPGLESQRAASGGSVTGTVLETMDASNYTYLKLKTASGEVWAAVNKAPVKRGARVTVVNAVPMDGFESKSLHRTFDHILFGMLAPLDNSRVSPVDPQSSAGLPAGHPATAEADMKSMSAAQHKAAAAGPADVGPIKVAKAEGASGRTVAEVYAEKASLKGRDVAIRGKVVKFTPQVMGKNWAHIRDGSGLHDKQNDDITVTTSDVVAVGDVVLVKGTVVLDKDFGAGYAYPVLIEGAKISK